MDLKSVSKVKSKAIIIGNGEQPPSDILKAAVNSGEFEIICADGGYHHAERLGIVPDIIIGDMDSLTADEVSVLEGRIAMKKYEGQNDTDVEKAISYCLQNSISDIALFAVTGKLIDHEISNIMLLFRYAPHLRIRIFNSDSVLEAVTGKISRTTGAGARVSFYAFGSEIQVKTRGLKYQLPDEKLIFGKQESTSNLSVDDTIFFDVSGGYMLLILPLDKNNPL